MLQIAALPRASYRYLLISGALVFLAYTGLPLAFWLCHTSSVLDGFVDGLGLVPIVGAGLLLSYVIAGAPVVLRLIARDLKQFQPQPIVRAEWLLAKIHLFAWVALIVFIPFYIAHWFAS